LVDALCKQEHAKVSEEQITSFNSLGQFQC